MILDSCKTVIRFCQQKTRNKYIEVVNMNDLFKLLWGRECQKIDRLGYTGFNKNELVGIQIYNLGILTGVELLPEYNLGVRSVKKSM